MIAEVIAGLAVVVGPVLVLLELQQNTLLQPVTATQALSVNYENAVDALGKDTEPPAST